MADRGQSRGYRKAGAETQGAARDASVPSELRPLLPRGDLRETFSIARYQAAVESAHGRSASDAAEDQWQQLLGWLHQTDAIPAALVVGPTRPRRAASRSRRATWGPLRVALGGLLALAALLGGWYGWQQLPHRRGADALASSRALRPASGDQANESYPSRAASDPVPAARRSGLPSVAGLTAGDDPSQNVDALVPIAPADEPADAPTSGESSMEKVEAAVMPLEPPGRDATPSRGATLGADAAPRPELDEAARAEWSKKMLEVRRLLGIHQYQAAKELLDSSRPQAHTAVQQAQWERLARMGELAADLHAALQAALAGLQAGEVLTIGSSTPVGVVDPAEDRLTFRIAGQNRRFSLPELPIGLVFALADLQLAPQAPATQARKAAFAWLHPGAAENQLSQQQARQWMAAAAAAGAVDAQLQQAFEDDYQLPAAAE